MKVGFLTKTNTKGQIVIPKSYRDELGINSQAVLNLILRGRGIYIFPVTEVLTKADVETSYLQALEKTQGSWGSKDWSKSRSRRRKLELKASNRRKKSW